MEAYFNNFLLIKYMLFEFWENEAILVNSSQHILAIFATAWLSRQQRASRENIFTLQKLH